MAQSSSSSCQHPAAVAMALSGIGRMVQTASHQLWSLIAEVPVLQQRLPAHDLGKGLSIPQAR
jgi:hypothetical protein